MIDGDGSDEKLREVVEQLKIYFKCTAFYEEQITQLYGDWRKSLDGEPEKCNVIRKKLHEANGRYNHLVRDGIEYIQDIKYTYPEIFKENISELELRDGWYDPYLDDDSELFDND